MKRKFFVGVIFMAMIGINFLLPGITYADDLIVIGNRSVPVSELSKKEVKRIYLGKAKIWDNGIKVYFARLGDDSTTKRFLKHYVKKSPAMFRKYWKRQAFSGGANPPREFKREKDLVQYVSETKGAVGYISAKFYSDSVKIISVVH